MPTKLKNYQSIATFSTKPRQPFVIGKPTLIRQISSNSIEWFPKLKEDATKTYCHGLVLGYKDEDGKQRVWQHIGTTGGDTEKKAFGILVCSDLVKSIALKSSDVFKDTPLGPWCVIVRNAVVSRAALVYKSPHENNNKEVINAFDFKTNENGNNDVGKYLANLENKCNIKTWQPVIALREIVEKEGVLTNG